MIWPIVFFSLSVFAPVAMDQNVEGDAVEVESEAVYTMRGKDSKNLAMALALFEAKSKAVEIGAKYLATKGLIEVFGERKKEIYALAAGEIKTKIVEERWQQAGEAIQCLLRIRTLVKDSDFIKAEMQDQRLEAQDSEETFRQEMEPDISKKTDPSTELAKAYRLMRNRDWRMAVIYLDQLEIKYPNWGYIHMAKAIVYYALHEPHQMKKSLEMACGLDNEEACEDLKRLKKVHDIDLDE